MTSSETPHPTIIGTIRQMSAPVQVLLWGTFINNFAAFLNAFLVLFLTTLHPRVITAVNSKGYAERYEEVKQLLGQLGIALPGVPDPQAAAQWYFDHLGGEWVDERDDRLLFGTTRIMFLRGEGRAPSQGGVIDHLGFSVPDLDAKIRQLEAAGATVTTPPREVQGLFKLAFVNDPWGVRLEILGAS